MNLGNEQKAIDSLQDRPQDAIGEILALSAQAWMEEVAKKRCICCGGPAHDTGLH